MPAVCVIPSGNNWFCAVFCTPIAQLIFTCFNIISPMQVILAMRINCYSFVPPLLWDFPYLCLLSGSDMVLPSSNLQPEAIINILQKKKSQRNGVQHHGWGLSRNETKPTKRKTST
jgi:hypothetical protein